MDTPLNNPEVRLTVDCPECGGGRAAHGSSLTHYSGPAELGTQTNQPFYQGICVNCKGTGRKEKSVSLARLFEMAVQAHKAATVKDDAPASPAPS